MNTELGKGNLFYLFPQILLTFSAMYHDTSSFFRNKTLGGHY